MDDDECYACYNTIKGELRALSLAWSIGISSLGWAQTCSEGALRALETVSVHTRATCLNHPRLIQPGRTRHIAVHGREDLHGCTLSRTPFQPL